MDDMIYDLENKIEMLKEQPETAGFMRKRFVVYNIGQRYKMLYNGCTSNGAYVPNALFKKETMMKKIKDELSATDYDTLQHTTYESSKETIKKYIEILNHLVDKGIFDIPEPKIPPCPNEINGTNISSQFQSSDKVKLRVGYDPFTSVDGFRSDRNEKNDETSDLPDHIYKPECMCKNDDKAQCVNIVFNRIKCNPSKLEQVFIEHSKLYNDTVYLTENEIKFSALVNAIYLRQRLMTKLLSTIIGDVKTSSNVSDDDHNGTDYTGPLMSIRFNNIDSFDVAKRIHDTFVGDKDYINNNIVLTINESDVIVAICIDDVHSMPYDLSCKLIKAIVNTIPDKSEQ